MRGKDGLKMAVETLLAQLLLKDNALWDFDGWGAPFAAASPSISEDTSAIFEASSFKLPFSMTNFSSRVKVWKHLTCLPLLRTPASAHVLAARPWHTGYLFVSSHAVFLPLSFRFDVLV
jgi:hypothetical protein